MIDHKMLPPEPSSERATPGQTPRWQKAMLYLSLVVLIVALNYLAARNEGRRQRDAPRKSSAKADPRRPRDPGPTSSSNTTMPRPSIVKDTNEDHSISRPDTGQSSSGGKTNATRPVPRAAADDNMIMRNQRIRDETGSVVYSGDVELQPTLDRIERGKQLRFPNDGSVFENREHRLPKKSAGYYHEYVLPTPGDDGPGAQRIVIGSNGEVYYTPDHYRTFRRVR